MTGTIQQVQVNQKAINDPKYDLIYSVENVNRQVLEGTSFRDAYMEIANHILSQILLFGIPEPVGLYLKSIPNNL